MYLHQSADLWWCGVHTNVSPFGVKWDYMWTSIYRGPNLSLVSFAGIASDTREIVVFSKCLDFVIIGIQIGYNNGVPLIRFHYRCLIYL